MITESVEIQKMAPIQLPTTRKVVVESHLATSADRFSSKRPFPRDQNERVGIHMVRSCQRLLGYAIHADCTVAYQDPSVQVWTPAEGGGQPGQGSVDKKPPPDEEMWSGNLNWRANGKGPAPGTRYLLSHGDQRLVLIMGYETGPSIPVGALGVQSEVAYYLGVTNDDTVTLGRLTNQTVAPGPVQCQQSPLG
jgi:hypothetical protein